MDITTELTRQNLLTLIVMIENKLSYESIILYMGYFFNNDNDDLNLWFMINSGYVEMGVCGDCKTPEEFMVIDKTWKAYRKSMEAAKGEETN